MNKKLLAAAVAAAVVGAPAAYAESTVYGKFHVSIDSVDISSSPSNLVSEQDNWEVNSRSSRLGFKGSEDLGGGLKATYQLELSVDVTDGGGVSGTNRNTFVGLAGDFGEVRVGRHDTPAKMAFYGAGTENLGDSILDLNTGGLNPIGVFSEVRASNVIAYVSPNFSGFQVAAAVVPGEESGNLSTSSSQKVSGTMFGISTTTSVTINDKNSNDGIADSYSIGAWYSGGGLRVGAGYEKLAAPQESGSSIFDDSKMMQIGASYTMNAFTVGAHYESTDNWRGVDGMDLTAWGITGKATFGNNAIMAVYTNGQVDMPAGLSGDLVDGDGWGIGAEHNFSKRTKVYAAYATGSADTDVVAGGDADNDQFSLGMIHNF